MALVIQNIACEITKKESPVDNIAIIGIRTRGAVLADRLQRHICRISGMSIPLGALDITLYRDDLSHIAASQPALHNTEIGFDIEGKVVILVDDVLYTGRTIRCALSELVDFGRPAAIRLAVLVDRGHRELPIRPDYVGRDIRISSQEEIVVRMQETDGKDEVAILVS